eukprot:GDKI01039403.1.p1 GENE.GDKI01039403.1~~GDKI01039403.1.p1  ORF type:complete len:205 (-),score=56.11 GDKI01039403.1:42-569(-)
MLQSKLASLAFALLTIASCLCVANGAESLCSDQLDAQCGTTDSPVDIAFSLDNSFGGLAFENLNNAATTNLSVNYRAPIMAGTSIVVVSGVAARHECGKKLSLEGTVFGENGRRLATATAEFVDVSDKWSKIFQQHGAIGDHVKSTSSAKKPEEAATILSPASTNASSDAAPMSP